MKTIVRKFKVSDLNMLEHSKTMLQHFLDEQATFTAFDADFASPFETDWESAISSAKLMPTDETIKDQLQQHTAKVDEVMEKCRFKFQQSKYFIEKAFPSSPATRNEFGFDDYDTMRKSQVGMIQFMRTFFATATKYAAELAAAGYDAAAVADIDALTTELEKANDEQEKFKGTRSVTAEDRVNRLNKAWDVMVQVSKAGKTIFFAEPAKYQLFLLPASSETGEDISIAGTVTEAPDTPLENVTVSVDELGVDTTTDSNGNYVFGNLPAGTYTLTFSKEGYQPLTIAGVAVTSGETTNVDAQLLPA
ncbi:MAG: hypothetical protein RL266_289 [Bacteroidota bacterium]|jgi:hypothetical protein